LQQVEGRFLAAYAKLLARTSRLVTSGDQYLDQALATGRPLLFAVWHGQTHLLYPLIRGRIDLSRMVLMVVDDDRRHVLESFARAIKLDPYPIGKADNSMAGARNMIHLVRLLQDGRSSYITPDGPDGPARVAKPGVAFLASRAGALVLPIASHSPGAYHLRRWDRYALPLPFGRIYVAMRPPMSLDRGGDEPAFLQKLEHELDAALELAEAMLKRS